MGECGTRLARGILVALAALTVFLTFPAAASCTLPVPDGGDKPLSRPNVEGRISGVGQGFVDVALDHRITAAALPGCVWLATP